jgi:serine/threonine-protein kinase/endoribonuclease IRE1
VYDLLLPLHSAQAHPIFVPQPLPHLPSLFPNPAAHLEILAKPPTTYVGSTPVFTVPDPDIPLTNDTPPHRHIPTFRFPLTYALSSASYPLINFAPPARPGQLTNGSFHLSDGANDRGIMPYLLDPAEPKTLVSAETIAAMPSRGYSFGKWIFITLAGILLALLGFLSGRWRTKRTLGMLDNPQVYMPQEKQLRLPPAPVSTQPLAPLAPEAPVPSILRDSTKQPAADDDSTGQSSTVRKTNARRRVRGGKKRRGKSEDSEVKEGSGSGSGSELLLSEKWQAKPLPDLPIEEDNLVMDKLTVTDTIIGESAETSLG